MIASQKFEYALTFSNYSAKSALLWGNCAGHFGKVCEGDIKHRVIHLLLAVVELIPVIGQIASIFEASIIKSGIKKINEEQKNLLLTDHPLLHATSAPMIDFLLKCSAQNIEIGENSTPLVEAISKADIEGDGEIVRMFINAQADLNSKDAKGYTPLMLAIQGNKQNIAKILIEADGIDLYAQDNEGGTALMWAAFKGQIEVVEKLIECIQLGQEINRTKIDQQNNTGKTALMWAILRDQKDIAIMIINAIDFLRN